MRDTWQEWKGKLKRQPLLYIWLGGGRGGAVKSALCSLVLCPAPSLCLTVFGLYFVERREGEFWLAFSTFYLFYLLLLRTVMDSLNKHCGGSSSW